MFNRSPFSNNNSNSINFDRAFARTGVNIGQSTPLPQAPFRANPTSINLTPKAPTPKIPFKDNPTSINFTPKMTTFDSGPKSNFAGQNAPTPQVPFKAAPSSINLTPKIDNTPKIPFKANPTGIDLTPKIDEAPKIPFKPNPTGIDLTPKAPSFDSGVKTNFPAPVSQHNSNNLQENFAKADWPHCDKEFSFFKIFSDGYRCFGPSIETKITIGPNIIKNIGPDIIGRKAAACFGVVNEVRKAIEDPCSHKHLEYQGKIDPYFIAMPMHDVTEAVKYSVEMGGENSGQ